MSDVLERVAETARDYVGELALSLERRRRAGESHIGELAEPKWKRLVAALVDLEEEESRL